MPSLVATFGQADFPRTLLDLLSFFHFQHTSHCAAISIRNAPCVTPVLKHGPKDALHPAGRSSHMLPTLLGSVRDCVLAQSLRKTEKLH